MEHFRKTEFVGTKHVFQGCAEWEKNRGCVRKVWYYGVWSMTLYIFHTPQIYIAGRANLNLWKSKVKWVRGLKCRKLSLFSRIRLGWATWCRGWSSRNCREACGVAWEWFPVSFWNFHPKRMIRLTPLYPVHHRRSSSLSWPPFIYIL